MEYGILRQSRDIGLRTVTFESVEVTYHPEWMHVRRATKQDECYSAHLDLELGQPDRVGSQMPVHSAITIGSDWSAYRRVWIAFMDRRNSTVRVLC